MSQMTDGLIERWILAFCEATALIDADLMERLLAEHEAKTAEPTQ